MSAFKKIAVIGAGTMGSAIAGQIANADQEVLLLDLPKRDGDEHSPAEKAITRLIKSDPPALVHKSKAKLIKTGDLENDFDQLADCDWIIEAIVERLPLKKDLYKRLDATIKPDCLVTSNTSTIPIKLLVEDMPKSFRQRFAITHYFNPVRYMRLLELVRGEDTAPEAMDRLAAYNDEILGKGVVQCADTPGFLGNRVGVFALQVGMDEAHRQGISIEAADALAGRPMGIPKTGVFGLYDLIGVDLMSDVVDTLEDILPAGDDFYAVGKNGPVKPMIAKMIEAGFTGEKSGKGGFYSEVEGAELALDLTSGEMRARATKLPMAAQAAAVTQANNGEALLDLVEPAAGTPESETKFARRYLARVLAYAANLIPDVTRSPQDIDDAMKLGFNWVRGPFEMMDALGHARMVELIAESGLELPAVLQSAEPFYKAQNGSLDVRIDDGFKPVSLPEGTIRFSFTRKTLDPLFQNASASLWPLEGDLRLIEFHSKANALTAASLEAIEAAVENPGKGIIVHNDAQHFSAGVDLNAFRAMIEAQQWEAMDAFLNRFQQTVAKLKYAPVPVIGAPSGLAIGGGFEVLAHCDELICHTNSVLGLVECAVGVVPGGGGVKTTIERWTAASPDDLDNAAWQTWMQMGYAKTGTSPQTSAKMQYYVQGRDQAVMNRDKLLGLAMKRAQDLAPSYQAPKALTTKLAGNAVIPKMADFMEEGIQKGWFFPHDETTAMAIASIVVNEDSAGTLEISEQDLFDRERAAFLSLAKTKETHARIASMLDDGAAIRN